MEFAELEELRLYLAGLKKRQIDSLRKYHDVTSNGFFHLYDHPDNKEDDFSKASTSTCVLSLISTGNWHDESWGSKSAELAERMLNSKWMSADLEENNSFTVAFILEAVTALTSALPEEDAKKFKEKHASRLMEAENILREAIKEGGAGLKPYPPSAYLTQLVVRVLRKTSSGLGELARGVEEWASREIEHQLALLMAKSKTADLFQLAYAIILVASTGDPAKSTPDKALILHAALRQLFERQLEDGSWPRSRPLFHYPKVGSAYCYEYEMLVQLISEPRLESKLLQYLPCLAKAARALDETAFKLDGDGLGWSSGHHSQIGGPESWSTASVYHFIHVIDRLVAEAIRRSVFEYFGAPYVPPGKPRSERASFAPNFLDCPVDSPGLSNSLREVLFTCFVDPIAREADMIEAGGSLSLGTPMSAIFFGPPGTSKTELTKQIAEYLCWPRLIVDPSHFVRNGMDKVQAEADQIFSMLASSERIVVLLDEFDEMVRDRAQAGEILSRFLTTAMLPKLAAINRNRRIVFIVATNHIDQFDLAISRPGRFDMIVQVMPPTSQAKLKRWTLVKEHLDNLGLRLDDKVEKHIAALTYDEFGAVATRLSKAATSQEADRLLNEAFEKCTLFTKCDPQGSESKTWDDVSKEQQKKIRVPPEFRS